MDDLTRRELEAARFASIGCTNREVAAHMSIKESAVKQYLYRVYDKAGVGNRRQLADVLTSRADSPK